MYYELDSEKSLDEKGTRKKEKANEIYNILPQAEHQ